MQYLENVKLSTRDREEWYRPWKSIRFYSSGEPEIEEILNGFPALASHRSAHDFDVFSILVEFHRDRGFEWRGILYSTHPVLLQPPTTYLPCILQRFWITLSISCSHIFFSETKYCYSGNDVRIQLQRYFFRSGDLGKKEIYLSGKRTGRLVAL